ncbi:hypothetical protein CANARDRAFT_199893 [[Candida] arabinofermentans NRRL YB-2248]|uniref:FAD dependent oxidoreductase domain-containing protein n=1 Tax=[Candida] arabinofermentans NRRL YB-2248 TaxID=983967 RepID=A0A1E4SZE0_9ASCO|nr:hypothetical protein CANARDRAFT_199893 [[Candida] arabinofermentans NRRL YB-2248]
MKVIVVGCSVFGLSTILELKRKGYDVLGLDVSEIPGEYAAAFDLNKIIRIEYASMFYTKLSCEALELWKTDPIYSPYYVKSGRLVLAPFKAENQGRAEYDRLSRENLNALGVHQEVYTLNTPKEVAERIPEWSNNQMPDSFSSTYNLDCAHGEASKSLISVFNECVKLGANFKFGDAGRVTKIEDGKVTVSNGDSYTADKIIVASGSTTPTLVNMDDQVHAYGCFVTHIHLNDEEYEKYKNMPQFFSAEWGYFFPPDPDTKLIKIGLRHATAFNVVEDPFNSSNRLSLPKFKNSVPSDSKQSLQTLFSKVIPELANKEPVHNKICWFSDSFDSSFIIDYSPYFKNVLVATGDSGHAYKFFPNIGKYIVQKLEGTLPKTFDDTWKWRKPDWKTAKNASRTNSIRYQVDEVESWLD